MDELIFSKLYGAVYLVQTVVDRSDLLVELLGKRSVRLCPRIEIITLRLEIGDHLFYYVKLMLEELKRSARLLNVNSYLLCIIEPKRDVCSLFLLVKSKTLSCLFRFLFKRCDTILELSQNISYSIKVVLSCLKLLFGLLFSVSVFRYACGFLEYITSFVALFGNYFSNLTLADYRVTLASDACIHKELVYIAKSFGLTVYKILALTGPVISTGNNYLVKLGIEPVLGIGIIKGNRNLGKAHRASRVGTTKDNVLHLSSAYITARELSEYPTHRIRNIRFSASVRTDYDRSASFKREHRPVREGFEAV